MTAQTAAREICSFIELCFEVSTGEASQEEIAKRVQQAIDEAVKEERERYAGLVEWSPQIVPLKEHEHIAAARYRDLFEYHCGISGEGPHAYTWKDKPHRLVYDLTTQIAYMRHRIESLTGGSP